MAVNEKYSFKDFSGRNFSEVDSTKFNDSEMESVK